MSGFQDVYFCLGYIVGVGSGARDGERGVVFSPDDQGRQLYLAKPADKRRRCCGYPETTWPECRLVPAG